MSSSRLWKEMTSIVVVFALLCLAIPSAPARAAWVPTRPDSDAPQARLLTLLEREDVVKAFETLGVDRAEAARRVAGLTHEEARDALARFDSLPAGGDDGITVIVSAVLLVFLVLLLTDLLGLTHFYPFTRHR